MNLLAARATVSYDEGVLSLKQLEKYLSVNAKYGVKEIEEKKEGEARILVEGMTCSSCVNSLESMLLGTKVSALSVLWWGGGYLVVV